MSRQIFINLPVKDLNKSITFYEAIGFTKNPQFSDETAASMVWSDAIYVMLLTHDKLKQFTTKQIIDAKHSIEAAFALSLESIEEMNAMADKAVKAGGIEIDEPQDYGFMQQRSFDDLDGHHWEVLYMDMSKFPG